MRKAIFVDKDGTLVKDVAYNVDPALIELVPDAVRAVQQWNRAGYLVIVISNQSGVAKGYFDEAALREAMIHLCLLLRDQGAIIDDFYYCPHHTEGVVKQYAVPCDCRKPAPGLILRAMRKWDIDPVKSWMIGDILNDVEAGRRAGCRTILVNNGNETEWLMTRERVPFITVNNLWQTTEQILKFQHVYNN